MFALVVTIMTVPVMASAEKRRPYGGNLVSSLLSEPVTIDPIAATSLAEVTLVQLLFDTLFHVDEQGHIQTHAAVGMPQSTTDGTQQVIEILDGITFHDGTDMTAQDVAQSLQRVKRESAWVLAPVRSIAVRDNRSVVLTLQRKTPQLAYLLAHPSTSITPRGIAPRSWRPMGSGPFRLVSRDVAQQQVTLRAMNHFAGAPYVETIQLHWYRDGKAEAQRYETGGSHISFRGAVAFAGHEPKYPTTSAKGPATLLTYIGFGNRHPALRKSVAFRQALSLSIGRHRLSQLRIGDQVIPTSSPVITGRKNKKIKPNVFRKRRVQAKQQLEQALATNPLLHQILRIQRNKLELIVDETRPDDREVAENVVAALYRLGVSARILSVSAKEHHRRVLHGQCDLYIAQLVHLFDSPVLATAAAFAAGRNTLLQRVLRRRTVSVKEVQQMFLKHMPIVPLFRQSLRVHHRRSIGGPRFLRTAQLSFADMYFLSLTEGL